MYVAPPPPPPQPSPLAIQEIKKTKAFPVGVVKKKILNQQKSALKNTKQSFKLLQWVCKRLEGFIYPLIRRPTFALPGIRDYLFRHGVVIFFFVSSF